MFVVVKASLLLRGAFLFKKNEKKHKKNVKTENKICLYDLKALSLYYV